MTLWNLVITDDTDRSVRSYLARTGGTKGDLTSASPGTAMLSKFVERAVRQAIFWGTVEAIWERNKHLPAAEVQRAADEAVAGARAARS